MDKKSNLTEYQEIVTRWRDYVITQAEGTFRSSGGMAPLFMMLRKNHEGIILDLSEYYKMKEKVTMRGHLKELTEKYEAIALIIFYEGFRDPDTKKQPAIIGTYEDLESRGVDIIMFDPRTRRTIKKERHGEDFYNNYVLDFQKHILFKPKLKLVN